MEHSLAGGHRSKICGQFKDLKCSSKLGTWVGGVEGCKTVLKHNRVSDIGVISGEEGGFKDRARVGASLGGSTKQPYFGYTISPHLEFCDSPQMCFSDQLGHSNSKYRRPNHLLKTPEWHPKAFGITPKLLTMTCRAPEVWSLRVSPFSADSNLLFVHQAPASFCSWEITNLSFSLQMLFPTKKYYLPCFLWLPLVHYSIFDLHVNSIEENLVIILSK